MANREERRKSSDESLDDDDGAQVATRRKDPDAVAPAAKEERTSPRQFVKEVRAELRKVAWPTRKETLSYSGIVGATLIFMTTLIFCLDWVFSETVLRLFNVK